MSFLTYFANGHANVGTSTGPVASLRMCNPLDASSLSGFIRELITFPNPIAVIPMTGHDAPLYGVEIDGIVEFGNGADGNLGRLSLIFEGIRPGGRPMFVKVENNGGAYLVTRIPREWLRTPCGNTIPDLAAWLDAPAYVRATMTVPLAVERLRGLVFLCIALVRGDSRPVTALHPVTLRKMSANDIAGAWWEASGLYLNTSDVRALTDACVSLGWAMVPKADVPIINGHGNAWKAMHAAIKSFACGLGVPSVPSIVDTTDGMLTHPITRALAAVFTPAMLAWGWDEDHLLKYSLIAPFV